MKNAHKRAAGKILKHGEGLGVADQTDVEQRADEGARIEGHRGVNTEDQQQAERELRGEDIPPTSEEDSEGIGPLSRDPSEPASSPGRQIPNRESEDEQPSTERLVVEGVEEAGRDQMIAARKRKRTD